MSSAASDAHLLPCGTCPWRMNRDATTIPGYNHAKAVALLDTVGTEDGFRNIMACHGSTEDAPVSCKGYLAREGWRNINVRLLLARGEIENPTAVLESCKRHGVRLHRTYSAVLRKLAWSIRKARA